MTSSGLWAFNWCWGLSARSSISRNFTMFHVMKNIYYWVKYIVANNNEYIRWSWDGWQCLCTNVHTFNPGSEGDSAPLAAVSEPVRSLLLTWERDLRVSKYHEITKILMPEQPYTSIAPTVPQSLNQQVLEGKSSVLTSWGILDLLMRQSLYQSSLQWPYSEHAPQNSL